MILVGRWSENFEIERYVSNDSPLILVDEIAPEPGDNNNAVFKFKRGFERTIEALTERSLEVVILTQTPDLNFNAPDRLARERYFEGAVKSDRFDARLFYNRQNNVLHFLLELQKKYDFALVGLHPATCDERDCYAVRGSDVLYSDFTHLTKKGAQLTLPIVLPIFSKAVGSDLPILNETPGKYAAIAKQVRVPAAAAGVCLVRATDKNGADRPNDQAVERSSTGWLGRYSQAKCASPRAT